MNRKKFTKIKAFTLLELMIVIVILGLLASFVLPALTEKGEKAKKKIVCIQMKSIAQNLKMYKIDNSKFPSTSEGLSILKFTEGKMPKDSWGKEFIYTKNGENGFELTSFGANKKEGGEDDIYYTKCGENK
jgi:general secretion pathway protein G